jgi:hypothetical protein
MRIDTRTLTVICAWTSVLLVVGCDKNCAGLGATRILPVDTTIAVGRTFTATFQDGGYCYGEAITEARYETKKVSGWISLNPAVATVDSVTGVVTTLAAGDATISTLFGGQTTVHVR